jgi:hypothetical protein
MKNLLILHLESISRQRLAMFHDAFPNTRRLLQQAVVFDNFFASATSTLMVVGYLFYGNDFEFDVATEFEGMRPEGNNRHLFSILREHGYNVELIALNGFEATQRTSLSAWPECLPPVWGTNDFPSLQARFDALTNARPFAIYVWDLITHMEHSLAVAPFSDGLTDQVRRACAVADGAIGEMLATLEHKGLLNDTTIVVYGDHGDDCWSHGFKGGMIHATEPYTSITYAPFAIRDPELAPATSDALACTIDITPTCLRFLGISEAPAFTYSGIDLLSSARDFAYSQNFTANQPDNRELGIAKAFAVVDRTYVLLASSRGLELYAYRLDPGNHCNLMHFFDLEPGRRLRFRPRLRAAGHFLAALEHNPRAIAHMAEHFSALHRALTVRVAAKRDYIVERGVEPAHALDPRCLETINEDARAAFFRHAGPATVGPQPPAYDFYFRLR